jgi:hypothetical protein
MVVVTEAVVVDQPLAVAGREATLETAAMGTFWVAIMVPAVAAAVARANLQPLPRSLLAVAGLAFLGKVLTVLAGSGVTVVLARFLQAAVAVREVPMPQTALATIQVVPHMAGVGSARIFLKAAPPVLVALFALSGAQAVHSLQQIQAIYESTIPRWIYH